MIKDEYYDIILRDMKETLENSKNKKALGIMNEMLKYGGLNIQQEIAILFGKIIIIQD